ncbi:ATP-grasp domain-containing protein [Streptomyces cinnamoneus]|uniref:ATP-grasp domain-containing protein n=1 Tax=Streptomyces cinnamoneus TaxID=53446 RepID=UPI003433D0FB
MLGSVDLGSFLGPEVTCGGLPEAMSEEALLHLLGDHRADLALPNTGCRGQEQFLPPYARAAARMRAAGASCRMPVHAERFALPVSDKVAFHRIAGERGWPVPRGVVCTDGRTLARAVAGLGFPALVKEARSEFGAGRHYVRDRGHLDRVSAEVTYPVVVQERVRGEEFAVEFLSGPTRTVAWPVASLGRLDGDCAPGRRVRVAPAALPAAAAGELAATVADMVAAFGPLGPWQMDFAVTDDGRLRVFELNGRLSGVSNMSWASTGTDPHVAYARTALGLAPPLPRAERIALELPVPGGAVLPAGPEGTEVMPHPGTPANRGPWEGGYHRPVLTLPAGRAEAARAWLRSLPPGVLLNSADEAAAQLRRGLDGLRQGSGLQP